MASISYKHGLKEHIEAFVGKWNRKVAILEETGKPAPSRLTLSSGTSALAAMGLLSMPSPGDLRMKELDKLLKGEGINIDEETVEELVNRTISGVTK